MAQDQNEPIQTSVIPPDPISSGRPESGPLPEFTPQPELNIEQGVAPSFPAPPQLPGNPVIRHSGFETLPPASVANGSMVISFQEAKERFEKGDVKDSGTWEAGVIVSQGEVKKAA